MKKNTITTGTEIATMDGMLKATGFNGSIVYLDEFNDEGEQVGERMLTLREIGEEMKAIDGQNHKVSWEEADDE